VSYTVEGPAVVVAVACFRTPTHLPPHPFTINTRPHNSLTPPLKPIAACLILAILTTPIVASAQQPRTVILLDPAHGGPDTGAHLPNDLLEKDLTLSFATILRAILTASSFTVISTRDTDPTVVFPPNLRAEIANHSHPAACLVLHVTSSGTGIHIITSALSPNEAVDSDAPHSPIPWQTAQAASISQSLRLANELGVALLHAKLPVLLTKASVRPLDNLTCPAVAIEIAPFAVNDSDSTPVTDPVYQQRIAQSIAAAVTSWRAHNPPPAPAAGVPR
jgi:N-acetylmuramoyl-L-alanine amidase